MGSAPDQGLERADERKRDAVRPLLAADEVVEDVLGNAVFTSRQFVTCTTSLGGGFRNPFAVSAVGFRYADIVAVVPATIGALRRKSRRFLVEVGTAAMPARGRPTDAERMALKFSNGWADPVTVDESYVARPNVVLAGYGDDGERLAQRITQALVERCERSRPEVEYLDAPQAFVSADPDPASASGLRQDEAEREPRPTTADPRARFDSARHLARGFVDKVSDAASAIQAGEGKTCPDCAEAVKADARVCRYCGFRFAPPPAQR